tara:strand:+ start:634 stop:852 length:219 start_codon:yes stop_codon:yes gene_type:complete
MILIATIFLYTGTLLTGTVIGIILTNRINRRNENLEFEYWIGSFEDEESDPVMNIQPVNNLGFSTFPLRSRN